MYAAQGQPCSESVRCLVGKCPVDIDAGAAACPTIIPDGQACGPDTADARRLSLTATTTCDVFSTCIDGVCTLAPPACP
jgi:hypothetical protein